jgi:hypothetical protein
MKYKKLDIRKIDIWVDSFPDVDLWHCWVFHLPNKDIFAALEIFTRSNVPWALITSHLSLFHRNLEVAIDGFRLLDMERAPFRLPPRRRGIPTPSAGKISHGIRARGAAGPLPRC